jgi:hypothetical protein
MKTWKMPMDSNKFGWESLLRTDSPPKSTLKAALFTTYDRADERLLVEHLLPFLLKLNYEPDGSSAEEQQYFLLELDQRLKQLHDKLVIVSSTAREEPGDPEENESGSYGWIWRSIRHLTVGRKGKAVQHAKLWLLHWSADDTEYIEIVVSSTNLTRSAFKSQIQGVWRTCIKLNPKTSAERLKGWGILPDFLNELAISAAGDIDRFKIFREFLARAECPDDIKFFASVPGKHNPQTLRRTPWGAAGLRSIVPSGRGAVSVSILSPFVGAWNAHALEHWCVNFEGRISDLKLIWIDKDHHWARDNRWLLPESTLATLSDQDATLLRLRHDTENKKGTDAFHLEHRHTDPRWNHAKVYSFKRGNTRRLLITSANFSAAAWGRENPDSSLTIENFELGVCVAQAAWPFDALKPFDDIHDAATTSELPPRSSSMITWAQASWDGKRIDVECRCASNRQLLGAITCGAETRQLSKWTINTEGLHIAQIKWADAKQLPSLVEITCEQETVRIQIFDDRQPKEREGSVPPGVDETLVQAMRDNLLFEQYGGRVAGEERPPGEKDNGANADGSINNNNDSYAVPAFVLARLHLGIVDCWAERVQSKSDISERQWLRRDGELLIMAFRRQSEHDGKISSSNAIGARLAAEEMELRLKHLPEA